MNLLPFISLLMMTTIGIQALKCKFMDNVENCQSRLLEANQNKCPSLLDLQSKVEPLLLKWYDHIGITVTGPTPLALQQNSTGQESSACISFRQYSGQTGKDHVMVLRDCVYTGFNATNQTLYLQVEEKDSNGQVRYKSVGLVCFEDSCNQDLLAVPQLTSEKLIQHSKRCYASGSGGTQNAQSFKMTATIALIPLQFLSYIWNLNFKIIQVRR